MRKRWIAGGMAAAVVLAGVSAVDWTALAEGNVQENAQPLREERNLSTRTDTVTGYVSVSGTTQAGADYQTLSLSLPGGRVGLVVDEVYVEAGSTVTEGQALLKLTQASLDQVEARLQSQLTAAQTNLSQAELSYEAGLLEAKSERTSNQNLKSSATAQLNQTKNTLANTVEKAKKTLEEAEAIVAEYPQQITDKMAKRDELEEQLKELEEQILELQEEKMAQTMANQQVTLEYTQKKESYETMQAMLEYAKEYAKKVESEEQESGTEGADTTEQSSPTEPDNAAAQTETEAQDDGSDDASAQVPDTGIFDAYIAVLEQETAATYQVYEAVRVRYENATAEEKALEKQLTELTKEKTEIQTENQTLKQEITQLESALERAEENMVSYQVSYQQALVNQKVKGVQAQNTYDQTMVTYNHTDDIYRLAVAELEASLQSAKDSYEEAKSNLETFRETLADGMVYSSQAGYITSFSYESGDMIQSGATIAAYYNGSMLTVSVSVDQSDISGIAVGDTVNVQISSASRGQEGVVTAINAQTESESISHVTYTVEITIDNADGRLSSGETAQIIFENTSPSEEDDNE